MNWKENAKKKTFEVTRFAFFGTASANIFGGQSLWKWELHQKVSAPPTLNYFQKLAKVLLIWELAPHQPANIQTFISKMAALIVTQTQLQHQDSQRNQILFAQV